MPDDLWRRLSLLAPFEGEADPALAEAALRLSRPPEGPPHRPPRAPAPEGGAR